MQKDHQNKKHTPVLLSEVLQYLAPKQGETYLDLTAGYGGHAEAVLARTLQTNNSVLVDRDADAVAELTKKFGKNGVQTIHSDFLKASWDLVRSGRQFDLILADLGVSSWQLDSPERGFSFMNDGPLDMRMDKRLPVDAATLVNTSSVGDLAAILAEYGEEHRAKRIAQAIVSDRPVKTTGQLAEIVKRAAGRGWQKHHPATRTFQALRVAVNSELDLLEQAIPLWIEMLAPGGRIAVISFHSLEDRIVKNAFAHESGNRYDARLQLLSKKPVTGTKDELVSNPRARSAKLRAAAKIKKKGTHVYQS